MFGAEAGKYLFLEAESEFNFMTDNIISNVMEPLDSELLNPEQRLKAKKNVRDIEKQVCRLVRIFANKQMQDKLEKEVKIPRSTNNDVSNYLEVFRDLKKLWMSKLCTPLEEVKSIREQLQRLDNSVTELSNNLKHKDESYSKYLEQSKEHKLQLQKEIEHLKQLKTQKIGDQRTRSQDLKEKGEEKMERMAQRHAERKAALLKEIADLENRLAATKKQHMDDETKLTGAFETADRGYSDALAAYDEEMRTHEEALDMA